MELHDAIQRRAMVKTLAEPVDPAVVDSILQDALRSPTAGNTGGTAWVVLEGPAQTSLYFDATTDEEWRRSSRRSDNLRRAPVVLLAYASADLYVARYGEPDKAPSGLGEGAERWPVPYWIGDAAFGVMTVLLGAVDAGLGCVCILGTFRGRGDAGRGPRSPPMGGSCSRQSLSADRTGRSGRGCSRPGAAGSRLTNSPRRLVTSYVGQDLSVGKEVQATGATRGLPSSALGAR